MNGEWYQQSIEEVARTVNSDLRKGLSQAEVEERLRVNGPNELPEPPQESIWVKLYHHFQDFLVLILVVASIVSAFVGETVDAIVILSIVVVNACLDISQEMKAKKALDALKQLAAPTAKVIRGGVEEVIPARLLVKGDIVLLETGDYLPADVRFVEAINLKIDEAMLTGESMAVEKQTAALEGELPLADRKNLGYMGTVVVYGRGRGVVIAGAVESEIGKIAEMMHTYEEGETPLQQNLTQFGKVLGIACIIICAFVVVLGVYQGYRDGNLTMDEVRLLFLTAISLAVAAIPEGLAAIVTIVLAIGMQRMAKRNVIVKRLHAVETLGSTTVICSDKTGTLTQNKMMVTTLVTGGSIVKVGGEGYTPAGFFTRHGEPLGKIERSKLHLSLLAGLLCNDAKLVHNEENSVWGITGDPTEGALVVVAGKMGLNRESAEKRYPRIAELPFDSERKLMTTFHQKEDGSILAITKGAPDVLLSRSTMVMMPEGEVHLDEKVRARVLELNHSLAEKALRVLAVGIRRFESLPEKITSEDIENNLTIVAMFGMIDPPRGEAKEAVRTCVEAGIRPVMITGDHPDTALAIAKEVGIASANGRVMTGAELDKIDQGTFKNVVKECSVFARVSPEHKLLIVDALKEQSEIVAMTGDGVNDAPALKKSDIGVAMGITGTDVAKETADMILTDDNFSSIVAAVEEGRVIYSNIRKFVFFLMTCNIAEILVIFLAMLFGWPVPMLPIQLLWLNLVTDAFPALALGMEGREPDVMSQKPRDPKEPLLNRRLCWMISIQSVAITFSCLGVYWYALNMGIHTDGQPYGTEGARTFVFTTLILIELLLAFSSRSLHQSALSMGLFSNRYMNMGVGFSFLLLMASLYGPLASIFQNVALGIHEWDVIMGFALIPPIAVEIGKKIAPMD